MRPIKLTMSAFGPYAGVQPLEMAKLGETGLYAITGETGAGKTTIFDAIMYALYNTGSGEDRDGKNLRCTWADEKTETYVELTFECGGLEYGIRRSPAQRLRGNKTETPARVALRLPDGKVITKEGEVRRLIQEEIIGVEAGQFSQIVMIAQGEFRKLVRAKSAERTAILRRIFKTGDYDRLAALLAEACKAKYGEYADTRKEILTALKNLRAEENGPLYPRLTAMQAAAAESLYIEQAVILGKELAQADEEAHEEAAIQRDAAKAVLEKAQRAWETAEDIRKKRNSLKQLQNQAESLEQTRVQLLEAKARAEERQPEIEELAAECVTMTNQLPEYEALAALEADCRQAGQAAEAAQAEGKKAEEQLLRLAEEKQKLERESEGLQNAPQRKAQAELTLNGLKSTEEKLTQLISRLETKRQAENAKAEAEKKQREAVEAERAAGKACDDLKAEEKQLGNTQLALAELEAALTESKKTAGALQDLQTLLEKYRQAEAACLRAQEKYRESSGQAETLRREANRLRRLYYDNLAGVLVAELEEGQPCPVCGSIHHPAPAPAAKELDKEQVERADQAAGKQEREAAGLAADCEGKRTQLEGIRQQLKDQLPELEEKEWEEHIRQEALKTEEKRKTLQASLKAAQAADARKRDITDRLLPQAEASQVKAWEARSKADAALSNAGQAASLAAEEAQKAAAGLLPDGWEEQLPGKMLEQNRQVQAQQARLIDQAEQDQKRLEAVGERLKALETEKERQEKIRGESGVKAAREEQNQQGLREQIRQKKTGLAFDSRAAAEAAIRQNQQKKDELQRSIRTAAEQLKQTENALAEKAGQINTLREQLKDAPETDLLQLETSRNNAQAALQRLERAERDIDSRRQMNLNQLSAMEKKSQEAVRLEREYRMMQDVAATASGRIAGQAKITLETYVQMALFDRILRYANLRLRHMSREQYELKRRPVEEAGSQSQTGLDLDVVDHYNGTVREVGTLSGGEGFLAALALALGMSDTIQAGASSAVRLDVMFVDEGFGSLSSSFLSLAMEELIDTAENGHRLIGIISHVEDVKSRLERRIEVTRLTTGGSTARIV